VASDAAPSADPGGSDEHAHPPPLPDPADAAAPWLLQYPRGVPQTYAVPPVTLDRLLDDAAQDFPESVALSFGRRRLTYRELLDQSDRLATGLTRLGVEPGDTVGLALGRTPQAVVTLFAAWRMHAAVGLVAPAVDAEAVAAAAGRLDCGVVVCEDRHAEGLEDRLGAAAVVRTGPEDALAFPRNLAARGRRHLRRTGRRGTRLADLVHRNRPLGDGDATSRGDPRRTAVVSELAGRPRHHTHAEMLAAAFHLRLWIPDTVSGGERIVSGLSLHTPLGLTATVTMPVLSAATMALTDRDGRRAIARAIESTDATLLMLPQGRTKQVVDALRRTDGPLRICLESGPVDHTVVPAVEQRIGARLRGAWAPAGSPGFVVAEPVYGLTKPGSVGVPVTDTRVLVVDAETGAAAGPQEWGRLLVAGPQTGGAATWHDTGERAALDGDGYLRFAGAPSTVG
jgi:long-chain acyl-CoA synthetase